MVSPVTFDHPVLLLLWPLAVAWFILWARQSHSGLEPTTQRLALILRCVLALLLVCMLSGMHVLTRTNRLTTIFLLDLSQSIRPDERAAAIQYIQKACDNKPGDDMDGIVVFGRSSMLQSGISTDQPDTNDLDASVDGSATNLQGALQLASASMPADTGRKIVILSDGNENIGSAEDEIDSLRASGVQVDIAPTALNLSGSSPAELPEAMVDDVRLPEHGRADTPFTVGVVVSSSVDQQGKLTILRDGTPIAKQSVDLPAGKRLYTFEDRVGQAGFHRYDAILDPQHDTMAQNNKGFGFIAIRNRPRVLYVTDNTGSNPLQDALNAQGIDVKSIPPTSLPSSVDQLSAYDSVILSNVPADELSVDQMRALEESIREFGVGFGMVGGVNSYAAGGYTDTPIEDALPVYMAVRDLTRNPPIAIAMVIEDLEEPGLVNESIEAAKATVNMLGPQDVVGVMDCNDNWRIPLQHVTAANKAQIISQLDNLQYMNDPYSYDQYLADAATGLMQTSPPIKHLIFLGDGDAMPPDPNLLAHIRSNGITISSIATGADDTGVQELADMAKAGGGKSYVVEQDSDLPTMLERDQETYSRLQFVESDIYAKPEEGSDIVSGIDWASAPPLRGYNVTTPKDNADIDLVSPVRSDPLLATWRYGLGRTFAFTSDDQPHWAAHWMAWEGNTRLWGQIVHWSLRSYTAPNFTATVDGEDGRGKIVVDAYSNKGWLNGQKITARVVAPDLSDTPVTLSQTAPGRYEGQFDADQTGSYMVNVQNGTGSNATSDTLGMVVPYSPEYRSLQTNLPLLTELADETGGKIQYNPSMVFHDAPAWVSAVTDMSAILLFLSALLFLTDIAARRLAIRPRALQAAAYARLDKTKTAFTTMVSPVPAPLTEHAVANLLMRPAETPTATVGPLVTAQKDFLSRRASGPSAEDNPFPHVASLHAPQKTDLAAHSNKVGEAQRAAKDRLSGD